MRNVALSAGLLLVCGSFGKFAMARDDQGVNDYAKAHWDNGRSCVPFVRKYESVCGISYPVDLALAEDANAQKRAELYDLRAANDNCSSLSADQKPIVRKGQIISVNLQQAYIESFKESGEGFFSPKRGEIAVVARVAELDEKNDFDFTSAGRDRGRLVYYSEGVQEGQFLNFSQLPIYGPIEYHGRPLILEFYIIELDVKENTEVSGLLTAAAGLGAVAYPPASPILKVLDTIGGGLLKANKSDLEFKYHATLLAGEMQLNNIKAGTLEYGNYAFVRMPHNDSAKFKSTGADQQTAPISNAHRWMTWWFNQKTGRIYEDGDCSKPLASQTYFTVQLNRAKEEATLDASNSFLNFVTKLTAEAEASTMVKTSIITGLSKTVEEDKRYRDAKKLLDHANQVRWPSGRNSEKQNFDDPTIAALSQLIRDVGVSLRAARAKPGDPPPAEKGIPFEESHAASLVDALNRLIEPKPALSAYAFDADKVISLIQD